MGPVRAILLTALGAMLTALFLWDLSRPQPALGQQFAIGGALFFAACSLAPLSHLIPSNIPPPEPDGATIIPNSTLRCLSAAIALLAVAAASILFLLSQDLLGDDWRHDWRHLVFWIIPPPSLFMAYKYVSWAFRGDPAFRLDADGLTRFHWGERTVPWRGVANVRTWTYRGATQLTLDLTPEFRSAQPWWGKLGRASGAGDLTLSTSTSGVSVSALEALVRQYWERRAN